MTSTLLAAAVLFQAGSASSTSMLFNPTVNMRWETKIVSTFDGGEAGGNASLTTVIAQRAVGKKGDNWEVNTFFASVESTGIGPLGAAMKSNAEDLKGMVGVMVLDPTGDLVTMRAYGVELGREATGSTANIIFAGKPVAIDEKWEKVQIINGIPVKTVLTYKGNEVYKDVPVWRIESTFAPGAPFEQDQPAVWLVDARNGIAVKMNMASRMTQPAKVEFMIDLERTSLKQ
jgi:hypothetical protein